MLSEESVLLCLALLPPPERLIITLHYGLSDGRSHTLLELGLSCERARQLEAAALKQIRSRVGL